MKRTAVAFSVLAAVGGCVTTDGGGRYMGENWNTPSGPGCASCAPTVPGVQGPYGQPIAAGAMGGGAPSGKAVAEAMIANTMPPDLIQQAGYNPARMPMMPPGLMPAGGMMPPGAVPVGGPIAPPGAMPGGMPAGGPGMMPPGMMPPGVMPVGGPGGGPPPGAVAAVGALTGGGYTAQFAAARTSIRFTGDPALFGMKVSWYVGGPGGQKAFSNVPLEVPGRYNFAQGAIYRLKLYDIPGHPAEELYPTLEVVPANAKTATFLAHSTVPVSITNEDLQQVAQGNYLVKVVYLPDPQFQDVALTGTGELISTQLEPGVDPIAEACKRGSILAVLRLGNINLEDRHTPAMDAPPPGLPAPPAARPGLPAAPGMVPPGMMPPGMRPGPMVPGFVPPPPGRGPAPGGFIPPAPTPAGAPSSSLPPLPPLPPATGAAAPVTPAQLAGQR